LKHTLSTDEVKEQAGLYALGALSQHEARSFEVHLSGGCDVCELELREFEEVVGLLGLEAAEAAPPPQLKQMLMATVAQEPAQSPRERSNIVGGARTRVAPAAPRATGAILPWALAACLGILGIGAVLEWRQANANIETVQSQTAQLRQELARGQARLEEQEQEIGVLATPGSAALALAGQKEHPESKGTVYWNKRDNRWVVAADLPPAPAGKQYQLWYITAGAGPQSAGMLNTDDTGHGFSVVALPPTATGIAAAAITLEPQGGSEKPTLPIYAVANAG
jgi:anti-sigma-K factor RskA